MVERRTLKKYLISEYLKKILNSIGQYNRVNLTQVLLKYRGHNGLRRIINKDTDKTITGQYNFAKYAVVCHSSIIGGEELYSAISKNKL